jgi:uncharacterized protein
MNMRAIWTGIAVVAAAAIIGGSLLGAEAMAQDGETDDPKTITVTSTASVGTEPDEATVTLGVSTQDPDSATALARNGARVDDVVAALEAAGVAEEDVRTARLNLDRRTINRKTPEETTVYVADSTLEYTVRDLTSVGATIQAAVEAGANQVRGVRFGVSDPSAARVEALEAAMQGARTKADAMAGAAGTQVTGVVLVTEEGARGGPIHEEVFRAALATDAAAQVVAPDAIDTSVTVTVTWAIA